MSKKMKSIVLWGIVIIAVVGLSVNKWMTMEMKTSSNRAAAGGSMNSRIGVKGRIINYETLVNKVMTTGTVIANEEVDVKSEISGRVVQIHFKEGGRVSKGDLLIKLNDAELQAQLEKSQFQLASSLARQLLAMWRTNRLPLCLKRSFQV